MNLVQFINYVDDKTQKMTHEELEMFIHEFARKLPETRRDDFLVLMNNIYNAAKRDVSPKAKNKEKNDWESEIIEQINEVVPKLEKINRGDVCLDSEYNETWDDWYNSDDEEIIFLDPENLLCDVQEAIRLIHECLDTELYEYGCKLCDIVSYLEIESDGDYNDYDGTSLGVMDLYRYNLIPGDLNSYVKEAIYLTYIGNPLSDRAEELYCLFEHFYGARVKLEDILQMGNHELPEFDDFLSLWIEYLGRQKSQCATELLKEAQSMIQDEFILLENARKYVAEHPELYLHIMQMRTEAGEENKKLDVGLEAIDAVPADRQIRSQIALWTAYYADKLCRFDVREKCWLEALRSDPSVISYIRIKFLPWDSKQYDESVRKIVDAAFKKSLEKDRCPYTPENIREKFISKNEYCAILFFEKRFDEMEKLGMSVKENLGWSTTFMKEGMALLLLLLYRGDTYQAGMKSMISRAIYACDFKKETLYFGTDEANDKSNESIFCDIFEEWKDTVSFPVDEENKWMEKLDTWIRRRVTGIMDGNKRNYYGECAAYIAALGEALESQGNAHAKAKIMEKYKLEYSRRRAFHEELRRYGMRK